MLSIVIVGTGNVANHLFNAFTKSREVKVAQVVGRNQDALKSFGSTSDISSDFTQIADADIYLVAVSDSAIAPVSKLLAKKSGIVAHTSGTVEMDVIGLENCGVFYPLQTFTKGKTLDFTAIPICIEARHESALSVLRRLGNLISDNIHEIDSNKRKRLHLAAVFANNFTNHLYSISEKICEQEDLPFELLQPLILETAEKVQSISPREAQTGPARRNDKKTMERHLNLLKDEKQTELYALFSEAIKKMYEEEL